MEKMFFVADIHAGHKNCLAFDNRPFKSIEEHDEAIIRNWNNRVGIDDDVWILGDFSWYNATKTIEFYKRLNGNKHLCIGNHDKKLLRNKEARDLFVEIVDYKEIQISKDCGIVLSHYPIPCFNNHYYGWYHLYGHVHKSFEWNMMENVKFQMSALYDKECRMYNVGIMIPYMEFMPKTLEEIVEAEKVYSALRGIVNV
jgi:calcineurin-like phosphoesterase family protein